MMIEYEHEYTPMLSTAFGFLSRKGKTGKWIGDKSS